MLNCVNLVQHDSSVFLKAQIFLIVLFFGSHSVSREFLFIIMKTLIWSFQAAEVEPQKRTSKRLKREGKTQRFIMS